MKTVLITGVSRKEGLGYAIAEQMLKEGFKVVISARDGEKAKHLAETLSQTTGGTVLGLSLDINSDDSVNNALKSFSDKYKKLDVLINNAGLMLENQPNILEKDLNELSAEIETNFNGTWRVSKAFIPLLKENGKGNIVNISSSMGSITDPTWGLLAFTRGPIPSYSLSKLILNGLTIKMAKDLSNDGIIVNSVCPGFTATRPGLAEMGARPVEQSIDSVIWAAKLTSADGQTGGFFRDRKIVQW